jgi:ABC-2 type transport system ATP-binding protein
MLTIENLIKRYGKFYALKGINLQINKGEIYGFVGPNGAGKTTTMKICSGLLEKTDGKVEINGVDISRYPKDFKKFIGYMPDFFGVYDDLKVTEYMSFYCGIHNIVSHKRPQIINELLELVNLSEKSDFYVDNLSRGMKQRLCLARCLIHNPELLILDEPASGLDPKARIEMKEILKGLRSMGKTILISSHILPELSEMCTSVGIIENGQMVVSGTVDEILKILMGHRKICIKTLDEPESLVLFLKEQPLVRDVEVMEGYTQFAFDGTEEDMHKMLYFLLNSGYRINSFSESEGNLETIFLHITGGKNNDIKSGD